MQQAQKMASSVLGDLRLAAPGWLPSFLRWEWKIIRLQQVAPDCGWVVAGGHNPVQYLSTDLYCGGNPI